MSEWVVGKLGNTTHDGIELRWASCGAEGVTLDEVVGTCRIHLEMKDNDQSLLLIESPGDLAYDDENWWQIAIWFHVETGDVYKHDMSGTKRGRRLIQTPSLETNSGDYLGGGPVDENGEPWGYRP